MFKEEKKVGSKGQVVIPSFIRKALDIQPRSKVVFKLQDEEVTLERMSVQAASAFESIARRERSSSLRA